MSRTGKIARLPKAIREQLNGRLQDGELGTDLVLWLNELPECQKLLAEKFGGRPISEQNLSEWKQGGYEEWARQEASRQRVQALMERADDLDGVAGGREISDRGLVAAELAEAIQKLGEIADSNERWRRLKEISQELSRLRREDHHSRRLKIAEEQWEHQFKQESEQQSKAREKEERDRLQNMYFGLQKKALLAEHHGGGVAGEIWANWLYRVQNGLPLPEEWWREQVFLDLSHFNPGKFDPIKPNQSKSNQKKENEEQSENSSG